jgi:hypothetical protein
MAKKKALKKSKSSRSKVPKLKNKALKKNVIQKISNPTVAVVEHESLKDGLLSANNQEADYDTVFEEKIAESYKIFRELKEHHIQLKKLGGILIFLLIIILAALLLLTFS